MTTNQERDAAFAASHIETKRLIPVATIREGFDSEHGCFENRADRDLVLGWLALSGVRVEAEDSGDGFRILLPSTIAYFWPSDASEATWQAEAQRLEGGADA